MTTTNLIILSLTLLTNAPVEGPVYKGTGDFYYRDFKHAIVREWRIGFKLENQPPAQAFVFTEPVTNWVVSMPLPLYPTAARASDKDAWEGKLISAKADRDQLMIQNALLQHKLDETLAKLTNAPAK